MGKYPITTKTDYTMKEMAALIDHSLLSPFVTKNDVDVFLEEVVGHDFKVCCVNNNYTEYVANKLAGTDSIVATVVAYPFGALCPESKASEVALSIKQGAGTIDIVSNTGAIRSGDWDMVYRDYCGCVEAAHKHDISIKAIIETCYITDEELVKACEIAKKAGMDFVKTSTGFPVGGYTSLATIHAVKLMKGAVGEDLGVKASGPIGDYETAVAMLNAGASRIGSRNGVKILKGCVDYNGQF